MELRQLRHFLALVEERSITRAAKRELIVQSGLSNSLQALERELGTPLYVRGTRPVRLTATGEALVGPARRTLTSAGQAEQAVHHTRDVLIGTLRLGVSLSAQHLVPYPVQAYLGDEVSKQLAQVARDVRGAVIPASGHNIALENPAALAQAYLDFSAGS